MEEAEVIGRQDGYWVVLSCNRRYYLLDGQFSCRIGPHVGLKGRLGYVQEVVSKVLTFTDRSPR